MVAGTPETITVTATDSSNNTASGYTGTVHFSSTDPSLLAVLPPNYTFTSTDQGTHVFTGVELVTAGPQTITATDTSASTTTGSASTSVTAGAVSQFGVSAPGTATAGVAISVAVKAEDSFGNTVTGYTGTVHISSTDSAAGLPADGTLASGTGNFSVTLKTKGTFTVSANDTVATTTVGTSGPITVSPGATTKFLVTGSPTTLPAGSPASFTVTAEDSLGNTTPGYTGTVSFTVSDPLAAPIASTTLTNGSITFSSEILKTAGNQTLTATDAANSLGNT